MLTKDQQRVIETMIDQDDLSSVLDEISTICEEKAQHIAENWQDGALEMAWHRAGLAVGRCAHNPDVKVVSR